MSDKDTLDGSLRKLLAVFSAACFSAHVVPVAGAPCDGFDMLANLDWSSPNCGDRLVSGAGGVEFCRGGTGGDAVRPILKPGTETPDDPSLFNAPWLR